MSKYVQLCSEFKKAIVQYQTYQSECITFANALQDGLIDYLGCSPDKIHFVPVLHEPDDEKEYFAAGALELADDGSYHFGIRLVVDPSTDSQIWARQSLILHFMLKKDNDAFIVKIKDLDKDFKINGSGSDQNEAIYQAIFDPLIDWYRTGFLPTEHGNPKRPLGFSMPKFPDPPHT